MNIITKNVQEITPYEKNAKKHPREQVEHIANSIREFGFKQPLVIDRDGVVIIGHGRLLAAKKLGMKQVPCVIAEDLSDDQVKALRLADNKTNESEWDFGTLEEELRSLAEIDFDMADFGFDMNIPEDPVSAMEDDYEMTFPQDPKTKRGDIYACGRHRVMCGDSTVLEDVESLMGEAKADMLLTDPPYGVSYTGKTKDAMKIENDDKNDDELKQFLSDAFMNANLCMKPGAVFYIWHADSKAGIFRAACQSAGFVVRQVLIWVKNSMAMGRQDYQWKHEPCLYGWKDGAGHLWASDRKQTTVLNFDRPTKNKEHPTMKPVPLIDYQMQNNTKGGDIVLDLFGGSGTTLIAAEQNGRTAYMMEHDPKYVDVIVDRWEKLTGEKAVLIGKRPREVV